MIGAIRQQAITGANVDQDLCCYFALQGHSELMDIVLKAE